MTTVAAGSARPVFFWHRLIVFLYNFVYVFFAANIVASVLQSALAVGHFPGVNDLLQTYLGQFAQQSPAIFWPITAALVVIGILGPGFSQRLRKAELAGLIAEHQQDQLTPLLRPVRVRALDLKNYKQGAQPVRAYFPRSGFAETTAGIATALAGQSSGVVLIGRAMMGKTRMALEALRATVPDFTLLSWDSERPVGNIASIASQFKGQRIAILLDDLQLLSRRAEDAQQIIAGVQALQQVAKQSIVIATTRPGDDEDRALQSFSSLIESLKLQPVRLQDLHGEEAQHFQDFAHQALLAEGRATDAQDDQFDGTPGSLLLGLARRTVELRSAAFPTSAKTVLKALALVRAGGSVATTSRIRRIASGVFDLAPNEWGTARDYLIRNEWLQSGEETDPVLRLNSDAYLEYCLPQATIYPLSPRRIPDDFPQLAQVYQQDPSDVDGLLALSGALRTDPLGRKADQMELALQCVEWALRSLTEADQPTQWADAQLTLGNTYSDRIRGDRAENLELSITCYTAALQIYTDTAFPIDWAMTQNNLGATYSDRIRGDRAENLELSIACYTAALRVRTETAFPSDWAMTTANIALLYATLAEEATKRGDTTAATRYRTQGLALAQAVLKVFTEEGFPDFHKQVQRIIAQLAE